MTDDTPTPRQSTSWHLWRTAAEELLAELAEYALSRRKHGDRERAVAAEILAGETAHLVDLMPLNEEWTDDIRVLRQQAYFDLRRRFENLMAGIVVPATCESCRKRRL